VTDEQENDIITVTVKDAPPYKVVATNDSKRPTEFIQVNSIGSE
jgi:hypothetical protein